MSIIDTFRLDGKVAVVTGANTGLGQGMSVALAQAGAKVVGVARRSCEDTKKLIEADGGEFAEVIADLSDMSAIDVIMNGALAAFGKVDILVNNAGLIKRNDAIDFTEDEWDSVIQVNQKMVFFLSQAFAKQYIKQGHGGKIININSMLSYQGGIRVPSYTASKSAGMGLTKAMCNEWACHNINVNAIAPGTIETELILPYKETNPDEYAMWAKANPSERFGQPYDIARVVVFLFEEDSDFINGTIIPVDSGCVAGTRQ